MLATLKMELISKGEKINTFQSSVFQGLIMEVIDSAYAETLHSGNINPYSQYILTGDKTYWIINTMTREAYEKIIKPFMSQNITAFHLDSRNNDVEIIKKELYTQESEQLLNEFYEKPMDRKISLEFVTPTSFKSDGHYVIIPDLRLIYQSLMNKYSAVSDGLQMFDEETLEQLVARSFISDYRLKSIRFPVEGIRIPAFLGSITIRFTGTETLSRYVRLLLQFGEYSGIGIKTAMGMGAMKVSERGNFQ